MALINKEDFIAKLQYSTMDTWGKDVPGIRTDFSRAVAIKNNFIRVLDSMPTYSERTVAVKVVSHLSATGLTCSACHNTADADSVFCKYCGAQFMEVCDDT